MIRVFDVDIEQVTHKAVCKAQEDRDLVEEFAAYLRMHRETIVILEDDYKRPCSVSTSNSRRTA